MNSIAPNGVLVTFMGADIWTGKTIRTSRRLGVYNLNYAQDGHAERQSRSVDGLQS